MKTFLYRNNLSVMTALAALVALFILLNWSAMPVLQRMAGLFFVGIVLHLWEEGRFPGGFTQMITRKLKFTQIDPHFGEIVTNILVLLLAFVPMFFPHLTFLLMAPAILGIVESFAHTAAIKMFDLKRPYSPGMFTALCVLLPMSIYTIHYAVTHQLMTPLSWLYSFLYMLVGVAVAQRIVVTTSGMRYSDFLRNARNALLGH